ncbi:MAG: sugar ABC transporter ATP-binding protein [Verrucomicrobia bacterium]|nr:sugar ABC transporter ATP-binding protein [Verrucomicrobiota bacterium]
MRGIHKSFPGVQALRGVDLTARSGEVLALLGENGAGKSTLMKVLGGAHRADAGEIRIEGLPRALNSPMDSRNARIAVIYQEFNLVPALSAAENVFLGREISRAGFVDQAEERRATSELFQRLGIALDPAMPCRELSTAQQQLVEIAKALAFDARILVMDEPTAALTAHETERLFQIIADLKKAGMGIIYISHRLDEIFRIADSVTIMRDGGHVADRPIGAITKQQMIELIVGRELQSEFPPRDARVGDPRLEAIGLRRGKSVRDVSFAVHRGEILALTGLVGSGRTETVRLLFGADPRDGGEIRLDGRALDIRSPRDAIAAGIGLLTEDRKLQGLVLGRSSLENFSLPNLVGFSKRGFLRLSREREEFGRYAKTLQVKVSGPDQRVGHLSGGNQQKVVLAKWLARQCDVLIFDEPTRGVDVGAKYEIYLLMNQLAAEGKAILMVSSELPEVLGMADRVLVMRGGRIAGEIRDARRATQEQVMKLAFD